MFSILPPPPLDPTKDEQQPMTLRIKACTVNKLVEHITTSEPTSETFRLIQVGGGGHSNLLISVGVN